MDPPSSLPQVQKHLESLSSPTPETKVDTLLLKTFSAQLTASNSPPLIPSLLPALVAAITATADNETPPTERDADPIATLTAAISRLLDPLPFSALQPFYDYIPTTLDRQSAHPVQLLGLEILHKAAASPSEAAIVATWPEIVREIVQMALEQRDRELAIVKKAREVLVALLVVDSAQGLVRRRVFEDAKIYSMFFQLTAGGRSRSEAQMRLLVLLEQLVESLGWDWVARIRDAGEHGAILDYAVSTMSAYNEDDDPLFHLTMLDFYITLIRLSPTHAIPFLTTFQKLDRYLLIATSDPDLHPFIHTKSLELISSLPAPLLRTLAPRLLPAIQSTLPSPPTLSLLVSLPHDIIPPSLLPLIPLHPLHPHTLRALASLLTSAPLRTAYLAANPSFWESVLSLARTPAVKELALPALDLLQALPAKDVVAAPGAIEFLLDCPRFADREYTLGWEALVEAVADGVGGVVAGTLRAAVRERRGGGGAEAGARVATLDA